MSTHDSDTSRSWPALRRLFPAVLALAAVGAAWGVAAAQQEEAQRGGQGVQVGTYEPQQAFSAYHRTAEFQREIERMQAEAAEDPQRAVQMQQVVQQRHEELIQQFQQDVDQTVPEIAEDLQLDLIAVGVVYSGPEVEVTDVTDSVVEKINEGAEEPVRDELPDFLEQ